MAELEHNSLHHFHAQHISREVECRGSTVAVATTMAGLPIRRSQSVIELLSHFQDEDGRLASLVTELLELDTRLQVQCWLSYLHTQSRPTCLRFFCSSDTLQLLCNCRFNLSHLPVSLFVLVDSTHNPDSGMVKYYSLGTQDSQSTLYIIASAISFSRNHSSVYQHLLIIFQHPLQK